MLGYFAWLQGRMRELGLSPQPQADDERQQHALRQAARGLAGTRSVRYLLAGEPESASQGGCDFEVFDATEPIPCLVLNAGDVPDACVRLALTREPDGRRYVGVVPEFTVPGPDRLCRAFLMEPEGLERLKRIVVEKTGARPDAALAFAFHPGPLTYNYDVARMVSACPDLDGELTDGRVHFCRLPVPDDLEAFPPRPGPLTVVIAFDWAAEGGV